MKGLLGIWLVICVCACTSKDVCHVQGRIEGIKDDVEIAVLRQVAGFQYDTVMNVSMQGGQFQFDLPGEYYGEAYELQFGNLPGRALFFAETPCMASLVVITGRTMNLIPNRKVMNTEKFPMVAEGTRLDT